MTDIHQAIRTFIAGEFLAGQPVDSIKNDDQLIRGGIIDSLGIFLLIGFIEKEFGVKIDPPEVVLENFETVNAIASLVTSKLAAKT